MYALSIPTCSKSLRILTLYQTIPSKCHQHETKHSRDTKRRRGEEQILTTHIKHITKTCLYDVDPLKPQFYIVKLGFTGVIIIFLISAPKHKLWVLSLEPP